MPKSEPIAPPRPVSDDVWSTLALMRFLFAGWVLFAHTANFGSAERAMPVPSANALVAVYCFLAISGFSIHRSIAQQRDGFGRRRFWRIAPMHVTAVLLAGAAYGLLGPVLMDGRGNPWPLPGVGNWAASFLLLQAFLPMGRIAILFPSWSLSLEVFYYALAPLLRRVGETVAMAIAAASCCFCLMRPQFSALYVGSDSYGIAWVALLWAWMAGWLLYGNGNRMAKILLLGAAGSVCIAVDIKLAGLLNHLFWWATLGICGLGRGRFLPSSAARLFRYLGEISYPMYILHYPVLFILYNFYLMPHPTMNYGWVQVVAVMLLSVVAYHGLELPVRRRVRQATTGIARPPGLPRDLLQRP